MLYNRQVVQDTAEFPSGYAPAAADPGCSPLRFSRTWILYKSVRVLRYGGCSGCRARVEQLSLLVRWLNPPGAADFVIFRRGGRVLVVDDQEDQRTPLAGALRQCGFTVVEAGRGREAIDMLLN